MTQYKMHEIKELLFWCILLMTPMKMVKSGVIPNSNVDNSEDNVQNSNIKRLMDLYNKELPSRSSNKKDGNDFSSQKASHDIYKLIEQIRRKIVLQRTRNLNRRSKLASLSESIVKDSTEKIKSNADSDSLDTPYSDTQSSSSKRRISQRWTSNAGHQLVKLSVLQPQYPSFVTMGKLCNSFKYCLSVGKKKATGIRKMHSRDALLEFQVVGKGAVMIKGVKSKQFLCMDPETSKIYVKAEKSLQCVFYERAEEVFSTTFESYVMKNKAEWYLAIDQNGDVMQGKNTKPLLPSSLFHVLPK